MTYPTLEEFADPVAACATQHARGAALCDIVIFVFGLIAAREMQIIPAFAAVTMMVGISAMVCAAFNLANTDWKIVRG